MNEWQEVLVALALAVVGVMAIITAGLMAKALLWLARFVAAMMGSPA